MPEKERDEDAAAPRATVAHLGGAVRHDLLITHNFVIGCFVRHVLDAPAWRRIGLDQANCGLTIMRWDGDRPPTMVGFNDVGHLASDDEC